MLIKWQPSVSTVIAYICIYVCVNSNIMCALYHDILYTVLQIGNVCVSEWMNQAKGTDIHSSLCCRWWIFRNTFYCGDPQTKFQCNHFLKLYYWIGLCEIWFSSSLYNAIRDEKTVSCWFKLANFPSIVIFRLAFRSVPNSKSNTHPHIRTSTVTRTHSKE